MAPLARLKRTDVPARAIAMGYEGRSAEVLNDTVAVQPRPRFTAGYSAARYAASAAMSSAVIAFIRSDMPGLLPRVPLRKSSIVFSR